jgi:Kef-type K+ transport system membrane component KefB/Trk K+ transport system NAD-binding subunit
MTPTIFLELALIIGVAAILALIGRMIKQPPIIAYLITGILIGPLAFNLLRSTELVQALAHIGVAFLLFIVGLSLDFRVLKDVGRISVFAGLLEILVVGAITFLIAVGIGFAYTPALYLAVAFAFSSTVVVVKLLSDKNELDTLHGRITLGILIVQDFVAAIALMVIPVLGGGDFTIILFQLGKAALLIAGVFIMAYILLPGIFSIAAKNQEVLFLFSIAWALLISVLFDYLSFSLEIGALIAGMALASSKYNLEIRGKIKGIRDFFVVLFFVFFGSQLVGPITNELLIQAAIFSTLVLIGNPLTIMFIMRTLGYKKRTNFFVGIGFAQISEFSLILILLGFTMGFLSQEVFSLAILVALITMAISSYIIYFSQPIYRRISEALWIFDGKKKELGTRKKNEHFDVILFGYNRIGFNILKSLHKAKKNYVIIDYNPKTISNLSKKGINCIYGDANDVEFLHSLHINKAKMVLSTIPDLDTNLTILKSIHVKKVIFIPTSNYISDAKKLYGRGADYVIMPHFLGGNFVAHLLLKDDFNKKLLDVEGKKQLSELNERLHEGHEHPRKDHHGA